MNREKIDALTVNDIENLLESITDMDKLNTCLDLLENDRRKTVINLCLKYKKRLNNIHLENLRLKKISLYENKLYAMGCKNIAGIDEAGRGPLAGPVAAAAVILKRDCMIQGIDDSKKLSERQREALFDIIMENALAVGVGLVYHNRIDKINILQATFCAMKQAIKNTGINVEHILVDGIRIPNIDIEQTPIIGGDGKSISIAAASIIAKVTRDRIMLKYNEIYPHYGFERNKGYGTQEHIQSIRLNGPCPIHRVSFINKIV